MTEILKWILDVVESLNAPPKKKSDHYKQIVENYDGFTYLKHVLSLFSLHSKMSSLCYTLATGWQ